MWHNNVSSKSLLIFLNLFLKRLRLEHQEPIQIFVVTGKGQHKFSPSLRCETKSFTLFLSGTESIQYTVAWNLFLEKLLIVAICKCNAPHFAF